jgi:hypothetical protein
MYSRLFLASVSVSREGATKIGAGFTCTARCSNIISQKSRLSRATPQFAFNHMGSHNGREARGPMHRPGGPTAHNGDGGLIGPSREVDFLPCSLPFIDEFSAVCQ